MLRVSEAFFEPLCTREDVLVTTTCTFAETVGFTYPLEIVGRRWASGREWQVAASRWNTREPSRLVPATTPPMRRIAPRVLLVSVDAPRLEEPGSICLRELPAAGNERSVFGDGSHPTTRLCAGAVDLLCRQRRLGAVLDVGTGTGVLARIARAHGARFVVGTDVDPLALECARRQCDLDGAAVAVLLTAEPPDAWGPRFDLVVANILQGPLEQLAPQLTAALAPGGDLLLSGFTPLQVPPLRLAYERQRLCFVQEARLGEWSLLRFTRAGSAANGP